MKNRKQPGGYKSLLGLQSQKKYVFFGASDATKKEASTNNSAQKKDRQANLYSGFERLLLAGGAHT